MAKPSLPATHYSPGVSPEFSENKPGLVQSVIRLWLVCGVLATSCTSSTSLSTPGLQASSIHVPVYAETFQSDSLTSLYQVNLKDHDIKIGKVLGRGSFAQVSPIPFYAYLKGSRTMEHAVPGSTCTVELMSKACDLTD